MKRSPGLLVLSLFLAVPLFARVISYAPYTSRVAVPAYQDRSSRYFALIEGQAEEFLNFGDRDVVLYDSTGAEEPRVITPGPGVWALAALYEMDGGTPVILAMKYSTLMISEDGAEWRAVEGLGSFFAPSVADVDTGGPFANGLFAPVFPGNDDWPFVATLESNGVWAISRNGGARRLMQGGYARAIGRNAAGDRFLIQSQTTVWMATLDGTLTKVADLTASGLCAGWITSNGTVYLEQLLGSGRTLYVSTGSSLNVVASAAPAFADKNDEPVPLRVFAVPTQDYEGAWIVERSPDAPTTLSRHTPSTGRQAVWSDPSGPQVEAVIAGASGETLLIQVHRERESAQLERPLIDPALAVWRVGEPAPRTYDELYLNEAWNKGFVIVDPDGIESGTAFVFNSGFEEIAREPARVSAPIGGGGDVVQEWGVVRGSLQQRLVLPGVARLRGAYESFWQTDVVVYNPLPNVQQVEMRFIPLGAENAVSATLTLDPHEIRAIPDVVKTLFFIESGGGTLHLLPDVGVNATARTYTRKDGGTYGYGMGAIDFFNAAGPRFELKFSGAFPDVHFRTNVLLTDTSGRGTHASFRTITGWWADRDAGALATPKGSAMQATLATPAEVSGETGAALVIAPTRGTAIATVVAIDNRSNDPTWFPPDVPGTIPRAIPVIGHVDGANGAKFRTDLYLHNPREGSRYVILNARKWDEPGRQYTAWVRLSPNETRIIRDAAATFFGIEGFARLRYASPEDEPGEGVRVTSRTYSLGPNGATYGGPVPSLNGFQIAAAAERLEILGARGGAEFRTNIGIVDLADDTEDSPLVRISIIGSERRVLSTSTVRVPARGGIQVDDVLRSLPDTPAALIVVEVLEGQQIAAYATLNDNVTNDPTYLSSQLGAKETN